MQKITDRFDRGWMYGRMWTGYGKWVDLPHCIVCDRAIKRKQIMCPECKHDYKQVKGLNMRIGG